MDKSSMLYLSFACLCWADYFTKFRLCVDRSEKTPFHLFINPPEYNTYNKNDTHADYKYIHLLYINVIKKKCESFSICLMKRKNAIKRTMKEAGVGDLLTPCFNQIISINFYYLHSIRVSVFFRTFRHFWKVYRKCLRDACV